MEKAMMPEHKAKDCDIVLFDANSYYASCHQAVNPELQGKPLLVAGDPRNRTGIILTASYEARFYGVKTAMPLFQALKLCPEAVVLSPDFRLYLDLSRKMWEIVERYTDEDHIEVVSVDECFADFRGSHLLFGSTEEIARRVQKEILEELGLGVSVGVSYCKIFAKLASDYQRDPKTRVKLPRSFTVIAPGELESKVWPLGVGELSGIGRQTEKQLADLGIRTIGDLAQASPQALRKGFGVYGAKLYAWANGRDERPVTPEDQAKDHSIGRSITLPQDITDPEQGTEVLLFLADSVGRKVRREETKAQTLTVQVKDAEFKTRTYSTTLFEPTDSTDVIYRESLKLLAKWPQGKPIRLLGLTASRLQKGIEQLSLFQEESEEQTELDRTVDELRDKYGSGILMRGTQYLSLSRKLAGRSTKDKRE
ncbi:DNA-directed DNA polymerase [Desulfitobacterium hafniense DCB-2]|uniref:DNA polymerase IV n=1 Tax=Desulfitobacterium hafniense (strain DSM 10664 / DCB-2) TaxID=272564 RepID=B8G1R4_DESHD|nr:DNA polymerase IV [Desulfitobacterium hafniense]ACL18437.1 DNA-directed DNA polymerase [Desulfitobacterium hafniense DCB-2]